MKYNITVDASVKLQLDNHIHFAANVSTRFAKSLRNAFDKVLHGLSDNPERYPLWLPTFDLPKAYHKILIKKRYLILFYIDSSNVFVDYILDCRMDSSTIF